jgi:hypothetical protein
MKSFWVKLVIGVSLLLTFLLFQNFTPSQKKKQKIDFNTAIESSSQEADQIEDQFSKVQERDKVTNEGLVPLGSKMNRVKIDGTGENISVSGEIPRGASGGRRPANRVDQNKMIEEELRAKDQ